MTEKHLTDQRFDQLPLTDTLLKGLKDAGFEFCTPIQQQSLPAALEGKDVAGQAQTGTGKTIAFLLACCNFLLTKPPMEGYEDGQPRALILAPTRELAIQIHKDAELLNQHSGLSIGLVYGGTGYDQQKNMLSGRNDILIGTPGRLIDFYKQKLFTLKYAQVAVMDEADRMFDLGFIKDIRYLLRKMPSANERLNLLFSATLSFRVMELAYEHMNDPEEIKVETEAVVAAKIEEYSYYPADEEKLPLLVNMIRRNSGDRVLVFVNTRHAAELVSRTLQANDINTAMLSGDVPQTKRERLLEQFKSGQRQVLVATDVAARGLHIPSVSHVYNYDLPQDAEDYVHRIGRTARAGASGEAISFICEKYAYSILDIEEYIGHPLPRRDIDADLLAPVVKAQRVDRKDKRSGKNNRTGGNREDRSRGRGGKNQTDSLAPTSASPQEQAQTATKAAEKHDIVDKQSPISSEAEESQSLALESTAPDKAVTETPEEQAHKRPSSPPPNNPPAKVSDLPRFSRKFGEVPLIG